MNCNKMIEATGAVKHLSLYVGTIGPIKGKVKSGYKGHISSLVWAGAVSSSNKLSTVWKCIFCGANAFF
jgi:hypothetical protein